ncbi:hypothetical protein VF12_30780, partial [Nostoc linckia z15]
MQAERERGGHFLGRWFFALALFGAGQQQARFQIGQPGGHHEIVGREGEVPAPCLVHEGQILFGQLGDRQLQQIDLLRPGERQKDMQGAFIAFQIDDEGLARIDL